MCLKVKAHDQQWMNHTFKIQPLTESTMMSNKLKIMNMSSFFPKLEN